MDNMKYYNAGKKVPEDALKKIEKGRLSGKSDINPQWRLEKLTEMFGMCGIGWKLKTVRKWIEEGGKGEKAAFVDVELYVKVGGEWSEAIEGTGGSSFVAAESKGLHTSDECFKMATTDAISVCCKMIGIAADIYRGMHDSKYMNSNGNSNSNSSNGSKKVEHTEEEIKKIARLKNIVFLKVLGTEKKYKDLTSKEKDELEKKMNDFIVSFTAFKGKDGPVSGVGFDQIKGNRLNVSLNRLEKQEKGIVEILNSKAKTKKHLKEND